MHLLTWFFLLWPLAIIYFYLGLSKALYTSVFCAKNLVVVDFIAQSSSSGLMTQQLPAIGLMTQSSVIGLMAQPPVIGPMAQSPAIGLLAQFSSSGLMTHMTQHSAIGLVAQFLSIGPAQPLAIGFMAQSLFSGFMTQLPINYTGLMAQLSAKNINFMSYNLVQIGFTTQFPANLIIQPLVAADLKILPLLFVDDMVQPSTCILAYFGWHKNNIP